MKRTSYAGQVVNIRSLTAADTAWVGGSVTASMIWRNNGVDSGGFNWFPVPAQGNGENNIAGIKFNLRYVEVIFVLYPLVNPSTSFTDYIRIMLLKERNAGTIFTGAGAGAPVFLQFTQANAPLRTKTWDVQMDKIIPYTTGLTSNAAILTNNTTSMAPKPIKMRLIIPLRHSCQLELNGATQYAFPLSMYLMAFTDRTDNYWRSDSIAAIYYFRDP